MIKQKARSNSGFLFIISICYIFFSNLRPIGLTCQKAYLQKKKLLQGLQSFLTCMVITDVHSRT